MLYTRMSTTNVNGLMIPFTMTRLNIELEPVPPGVAPSPLYEFHPVHCPIIAPYGTIINGRGA